MSKYIDADRLRAFKEALADTIVSAQGLPTYEDCKERAEAETDVLLAALFSLQQEQPIQVNTLTWRDINDLERIINHVHYEFRNGISEKGFGEEVLERFIEERDEQEQPEVDLEKEIVLNYAHEHYYYDKDFDGYGHSKFRPVFTRDDLIGFARHFYLLGLNVRKEE